MAVLVCYFFLDGATLIADKRTLWGLPLALNFVYRVSNLTQLHAGQSILWD